MTSCEEVNERTNYLLDVFRVAKKEWIIDWYYSPSIIEIDFDDKALNLWDGWFKYDPYQSLLKQSDETKQDIINLFT
jgi:hypothetical protein